MTPLREIRADFDDGTIVVYQAYRPEIAEAAVKAQRFVPPFSMDRMTWIKPSFLWMMERCGWATKPGQERVLAIRITRAGWEEALGQAALSEEEVDDAPVRVQWDPERDIRGLKLPYRSIQVGLGPPVVPHYVRKWTTEISDITPLVAELRDSRDVSKLPVERPYPAPEAIAARLRMTPPGA